jgi:hypothetical protein
MEVHICLVIAKQIIRIFLDNRWEVPAVARNAAEDENGLVSTVVDAWMGKKSDSVDQKDLDFYWKWVDCLIALNRQAKGKEEATLPLYNDFTDQLEEEVEAEGPNGGAMTTEEENAQSTADDACGDFDQASSSFNNYYYESD